MNRPKLKVGIAGLGRLGKRHAAMLARQVPGAELRRHRRQATIDAEGRIVPAAS